MNIAATVHRKTRDLVRDAAEDLLRDRASGLVGIDRAEVWTFAFADGTPADAAEAALHRILDDTTLVVNPNVHRWTGGVAGRTAPGAAVVMEVEVRDRVDARAAAVRRDVRERFGLEAVTGVVRSVLWTLSLDADEAAARRIGDEITGRGPRGAGVLANSHAQDTTIRVRGGDAAPAGRSE
jgi:hypothetical protein